MDNKIILELIKKNLEEINLLVEDLCKGEKYNQVLIEIISAKAKILYQELALVKPDMHSEIEPLTEEVTKSDTEQVESDGQVIVNQNADNDFIESQTSNVNEITSNLIVSEDTATLDFDNKPAIMEVDEADQNTEVHNQIEDSTEPADILIQEETSIPAVQAIDDAAEEVEEEVIISIPEEVIHITVEESEQSIDMPDTDKLIDKIIEVTPEASEKKVFGEKFQNEPSLNDRLAAMQSVEPKIKPMPLSNLRAAIGINDKFLFTKELFNNNASDFDHTVDKIDSMNTFLEVIEFLEQNYKWTKNSTSLKFMNLVKRRFEN
ncbi:MAG: hypothetical protein KA807_03015 [Prolixibacteraceae bacterium]|nr:hypothetical protein [Prolixibacteraceae bacterium]